MQFFTLIQALFSVALAFDAFKIGAPAYDRTGAEAPSVNDMPTPVSTAPDAPVHAGARHPSG